MLRLTRGGSKRLGMQVLQGGANSPPVDLTLADISFNSSLPLTPTITRTIPTEGRVEFYFPASQTRNIPVDQNTGWFEVVVNVGTDVIKPPRQRILVLR